jgi:hypothetical protein
MSHLESWGFLFQQKLQLPSSWWISPGRFHHCLSCITLKTFFITSLRRPCGFSELDSTQLLYSSHHAFTSNSLPDPHKDFKIPPQTFTPKLTSVIFSETLENLKYSIWLILNNWSQTLIPQVGFYRKLSFVQESNFHHIFKKKTFQGPSLSSTWSYIPEGSHLLIHSCEKLKFQFPDSLMSHYDFFPTFFIALQLVCLHTVNCTAV